MSSDRKMTRALLMGAALTGLALFSAATPAAQSCSTDMPDVAPDSRYSDNNDGTVTDRYTGLMWKKCVEGMTFDAVSGCLGPPLALDWHSAVQRAASVNDGTGEAFDYVDWRLPNIKELVSLHRPTCTQPAVNATLFPAPSEADANGQVLWSSTPQYIVQPTDQERRYSSFDAFGGDFSIQRASTPFNLRLVRDAIQEIVYFSQATDSNEARLTVVNERGRNKRTVFEMGTVFERVVADPVAVARNSAEIAYIASVPYIDPDNVDNVNDYQELFIVDSAGSNPINLSLSAQADEFNPAFSPDGSRLAFMQRDDLTSRHDILVINTDGTALVNVTANVAPGVDSFFMLDPGRIGWSADGMSVYYLSDLDFKLYSIGLSGNDTPILVSASEIFTFSDAFAFSPDARYLAWVTSFGGVAPRDELYTMDLATGEITTIHETQRQTLYDFAWSPDSQTIAIFDFPKVLTLVPASGFGETVVSWDLNSEFSQYYLREPRWSPDGNKLMFLGVDSVTSDREIFVLDIETGETTNVTASASTRDFYGIWLR